MKSPDSQSRPGAGGADMYYLFLAGSILSIIFAVYWQSVSLPFIQDDWGLIEFARTNGPLALIRSTIDPSNSFFYRPLAKGYLFLMYRVFGANPLPFHLAALAVHAFNAFLVALIVNRITRDRVIGFLTALIYAAAIAIHLDPLAWAVGIYDVGGALFFLLSLWLFMRGKILLSSLVFFIGLLVKESIIVLPVILLSYLLLVNPMDMWKQSVSSRWKHALPFLLAMVTASVIRTMGTSTFGLPASHPYAIDLWGAHVAGNALLYFGWMLQSLLPFISVSARLSFLLSLGLGVLLIFYFFLASSQRIKEPRIRIALFFIVWLIAGLLPVIFLSNHVYRYYAVYSLPAFIVLFLLLGKSFLLGLGFKSNVVTAILVIISSLAVTGSAVAGNQIYRQGLSQSILADGTNQLIARAATVDMVQAELKRDLPTVPVDSTIVMRGVDLWAFNKHSGPQLWYDDPTLRVYDWSELVIDNGQPYIVNPVESQIQGYTGPQKATISIDPSRLFIYQWSDGRLVRLDYRELGRPR